MYGWHSAQGVKPQQRVSREFDWDSHSWISAYPYHAGHLVDRAEPRDVDRGEGVVLLLSDHVGRAVWLGVMYVGSPEWNQLSVYCVDGPHTW